MPDLERSNFTAGVILATQELREHGERKEVMSRTGMAIVPVEQGCAHVRN